MKNQHLKQRVAIAALFVAALWSVPAASAAVREYMFSGPSLVGRFIVEEYSTLTAEEQLQRTFSGAPYLFTATAGNLTYTTDSFELGVWNSFVAFGRSDAYGLNDANDKMSLSLMGPSLFLPHTSTLPHSLEAYSGLAQFRIWDPVLAGFVEIPIHSLTQVPEPASLGVIAATTIAGVSYRLFRRRRAVPKCDPADRCITSC